ncbi:myocardin-related transcription factor A isoform X1 [Synchiropus splendidus]|uniref:myocardin-related transcription factor A isoform X1 n=2 Tax=Synchiropus splendidus TaxID=270530 RepID=UPI00237D6846|nr:myocardin-related transcription factor A isoform X1 [Synchiropus splendidus]
MGLQTWPPSKPALPSMACLDVETPSICRGKFKSVLQLCLQQRRSREQLAEQGIMPPLKTPVAFHKQIRSLERSRTGNFLKHKLCSRPERAELVRMHILQETQAEASLQATQLKLKRARLADDLNEKIAQRPGPMELVEKNILAVDPAVKKKSDGGNGKKADLDVYSFNDGSSDGSSPEPTANQGSPSADSAIRDIAEDASTKSSKVTSDSSNLVSSSEEQSNPQTNAPPPVAAAASTVVAGPVLIKQTLPKSPSDKTRSKKSKDAKPRIKKLKYHQYIPPDQKQELSTVQMDSAYARLLQQQQQFLQLQIINQQQYSYQTVLPPQRPTSELQSSCSSNTLTGTPAPAPVSPRLQQQTSKPDHLPPNIDEMKVAELKMELKLRSLPVSGTKTELIERLKQYQENTGIQIAAVSQSEKFTPPVSPVASKVSTMAIEDSSTTDSPSKTPPHDECPTESWVKDRRLHEKEQQIEELKRKLEREQKLVEELRMQLEKEKKNQQGEPPPRSVKDEQQIQPNCAVAHYSPTLPVMVKQEPPDQIIGGHQPAASPALVQQEMAACNVASFSEQKSTETAQQPENTNQRWSTDRTGHLILSQSDPPVPDTPVNKSPCSLPSPLMLQQVKFPSPLKCGDPPRYEDAVKLTRLLTAAQGETVASQQMDDLFDVLIESGEMSPLVKQNHSSPDKPQPVTANVTTLPINTVLSRPPALVQVGQQPAAGFDPSTLAVLSPNPEPHALKLLEDLPMSTMEVDLTLDLNLHSTNVDHMDWMDLSLSAPGGDSISALDPGLGVFSSFLDAYELH